LKLLVEDFIFSDDYVPKTPDPYLNMLQQTRDTATSKLDAFPQSLASATNLHHVYFFLGSEDEPRQEINHATIGEDIQQSPSNLWQDYFSIASDIELDRVGESTNYETNATFTRCPVDSNVPQVELAQVDCFQIDIDPGFPNRLMRLNERHENLNQTNRTLATMVKNRYLLSSSEERLEDWLEVLRTHGFEKNEMDAW